MENIRRNIKLFFVYYGELLTFFIGTALAIIFVIQWLNNLVIKNKEDIYFTEKKILTNDFNKLPIPNRDLLDITKYMDTRTIITLKAKCQKQLKNSIYQEM